MKNLKKSLVVIFFFLVLLDSFAWAQNLSTGPRSSGGLFQNRAAPTAAVGKNLGRYFKMGIGIAQSTDDSLIKQPTYNPLVPGNLPSDSGNIGNGNNFTLALGTHFTDFIRGEISYSSYTGFEYEHKGTWSSGAFAVNSSNGGDVNSNLIMGHLLYDIQYLAIGKDRWFMPYVGGGIGYAFNELENFTLSIDDGTDSETWKIPGKTTKSVAWYLGAGLGFQITPSLNFDVSYKYLSLGDLETNKYGIQTAASAGPVLCGTLPCQTEISPQEGELTAHDIMLGIRVQI